MRSKGASTVSKKETKTHTIGVAMIAIANIKANPHNPRLLFDREDLDVLRDSIKDVGILVPLIVYQEKATGSYIILDGQRRWICAKEAGLKEVPVNAVAEPSLVQNIVTMFQIHKLRKDWELMPTALKLELLMIELNEKRDKRISKLTGLDESVVIRCKKLLSYPSRYQDMMLDSDPKKRQKADFFIELYPVRNDRVVNKFDWFKKDKFTDSMLLKNEAGALKSVTEFRVLKQHINNAVKADKIKTISKKLQEFSENPNIKVDHLNIDSAQVIAQSSKLRKSVSSLYNSVDALDIEAFVGEEELWNSLLDLSQLIRNKLRELGWRDV